MGNSVLSSRGSEETVEAKSVPAALEEAVEIGASEVVISPSETVRVDSCEEKEGEEEGEGEAEEEEVEVEDDEIGTEVSGGDVLSEEMEEAGALGEEEKSEERAPSVVEGASSEMDVPEAVGSASSVEEGSESWVVSWVAVAMVCPSSVEVGSAGSEDGEESSVDESSWVWVAVGSSVSVSGGSSLDLEVTVGGEGGSLVSVLAGSVGSGTVDCSVSVGPAVGESEESSVGS